MCPFDPFYRCGLPCIPRWRAADTPAFGYTTGLPQTVVLGPAPIGRLAASLVAFARVTSYPLTFIPLPRISLPLHTTVIHTAPCLPQFTGSSTAFGSLPYDCYSTFPVATFVATTVPTTLAGRTATLLPHPICRATQRHSSPTVCAGRSGQRVSATVYTAPPLDFAVYCLRVAGYRGSTPAACRTQLPAFTPVCRCGLPPTAVYLSLLNIAFSCYRRSVVWIDSAAV